MALEQIAEEYFSQLNPMARRMYADMKETKSAYEDLWESISEKEQKQLLSESIITPEVLLKYDQNVIEESVSEYAVKLIIDDHCTYQDEHSGPFSFKTRSQRNLTLFEAEEKPKPVVKHKPKKKVVEMFEVPEGKIEKESGGNTLPKTGLDFLDNW